MKRIAFISEHASPLALLGGTDNGGQNVYVAELAKQLHQKGYHIDIYTRRESADVAEVVQWEPGIRVIHVTAGPAVYIPKEQLLQYMHQFTDNMLLFIDEQQLSYELIHAHFFMSAWVASHIKEAIGIPYVVTFHALGLVRKLHQQKEDGFPPERTLIERHIVQDADLVIAECPQDREDLMVHYNADPARIVIIPCGFNPREFYPIDKLAARKELGIAPGEKIILQLGRMVPRKGVDNVIRAVAALQHQVKQLKLFIVGGESDTPDPVKTPEIGRLQQIAQSLGIQQQVVFTGRKTRSVLKYYYAAADIFISTPWYEPFGITPLEAMACGTPVIGSNVGGIKYSIADQQTGFLVPPREPALLAEKIKHLLSDSKLHELMCKNAVKHVKHSFTWSKVATAVHHVYTKVVSETQKNMAVPRKARVTENTGLLNIIKLLPDQLLPGFKNSIV